MVLRAMKHTKSNMSAARYLGCSYPHYKQYAKLYKNEEGKTLFEVYRDEHAPVMTDALCSEINHQKYYSGEFDIEWGQSVHEGNAEWHKKEMQGFKTWLKENNYDLVIIGLGANDMLRGIKPENIKKNLEKIIKKVKQKEINIYQVETKLGKLFTVKQDKVELLKNEK